MSLLVAALIAVAPADLAALAQQRAWAELLERAEGVAPADRDEKWRALVGDAAAAVTRASCITKEPFGPAEKAAKLVERFPFLTDHAQFLAARDAAIVAGVQRCVADGADCFREVSTWEPMLGASGALAAGKALKRAGWRPIMLFARAVGAKDAPACADADVAEATLDGLDAASDSQSAKAARQIAFDWCYPTLAGRLKTSMIGASTSRLENACGPMRARNALTPLQDDLCKDAEL